jgi:hypothetical protein
VRESKEKLICLDDEGGVRGIRVERDVSEGKRRE